MPGLFPVFHKLDLYLDRIMLCHRDIFMSN